MGWKAPAWQTETWDWGPGEYFKAECQSVSRGERWTTEHQRGDWNTTLYRDKEQDIEEEEHYRAREHYEPGVFLFLHRL